MVSVCHPLQKYAACKRGSIKKHHFFEIVYLFYTKVSKVLTLLLFWGVDFLPAEGIIKGKSTTFAPIRFF